MRSISIDSTAVSKIAVPTADSRSSLNTASYAFGSATMGIVFITSLSR